MITLIGKKLAKPGQEFIHYGVGNSRECMGCKLRKVCDNLVIGRRYVVKSSMNKPHEKCKIHEEGVMLVEVEPAEISCMVDPKYAKEGTHLTFVSPSCGQFICEQRHLCFPEGIKDGDKCEVVKVVSRECTCPSGVKLSNVVLRVSIPEKTGA